MAVVSETDEVLFSIRDGVATITLNRPDRLNAFTMDGVVTICKRLRESADDENVGVIVITGAGEKAFCTGGDVGDFESFTIEVDRNMNRELSRVAHELRTCGKPVIARVNGYCIGAGNEINMLCDLTIAAEHARFGQTGPKM